MNTSIVNLFTTETIPQIILVFGVFWYLIQTYLGYRFVKLMVAIVGFAIGFVIGFSVTLAFYQKDAYLPTVIGIVIGIVLALIGFWLYLVGVFIFCGAMAAGAVSYLPLEQQGTQNVIRIILCIAAFVLVGILAVKFSQLVIIVITSVSGALGATRLLATPFPVLDSNLLIRIAVIAAIAISGFVVQKLTAKRRERRG